MGLRDLIGFMTSIPVGGSLEGAARSLHLAPLVGLLEGVIISAAGIVLDDLYPLEVVAGILLITHVILTGGLHLDGFIDYVEAVAVRARGEDAERIIKDPRKGGFAIAYTAPLLVLRYALLQVLALHPVYLTVSYVAAAESLYVYTYTSRGHSSGLAAAFRDSSRSRGKVVVNAGVYITLVAGGVLAGGARLLLLAPAPLIAWLVAWDSWRRLGRPSGDAAGFSYETTLTLAMLLGAIHAS